VTFFLEIAI